MTYYEYTQRSKEKGWKFNIVVNHPIENLEYIHPIKQELVLRIYDVLCQSQISKRLIVFGSAITDECLFSSDLNICIEWNCPIRDADDLFIPKVQAVLKEISVLAEGKCDVLHFSELADTIVEEAVLKGVEFNVHHGEKK